MGINTVSASLDILNTQLGGTEGTIPATATKVEALREIYGTLGGTDDVSHISTVSEMVEKVAEVASGGGGGGGATPSFMALTITNNTAVGLYAWDYKYDSDSGYIYHYQKTIAKNATVTVNVPYTSDPWTTPITVWPSYECILKCTTSAGDISSMTVTSQTANINAIVETTYRSSESADNNMRAVVKIWNGAVVPISEVKITVA